jgi:hypothetical protein
VPKAGLVSRFTFVVKELRNAFHFTITSSVIVRSSRVGIRGGERWAGCGAIYTGATKSHGQRPQWVAGLRD